MSSQASSQTFRTALCALAAILGLSRFLFLAADFPNHSPWVTDPAKFTDEGWWANAAVMHALTGHWHIAGGYNPAAALPVWPTLVAALFHFTGVSIIAARALSVAFSLATLAVVHALVRRYTTTLIAAPTAVLLLASSPFAFVFSRLATLDTLVIFEFCLALLLASRCTSTTPTGNPRLWPLLLLPLLLAVALLTKTTFAVLLPAIAWIYFRTLQKSTPVRPAWRAALTTLFAAVIAPLALLKLWAVIVSHLGYASDYAYFFNVNAMPDIDPTQTLHWLHDLAVNGFWIDRILYPLALAILIAALAYKWTLWRNPLFTASCLAIAGQAAFIFSRQDDYAPRYFLPLLVPIILIAVLTLDHHSQFTDHRPPFTALFTVITVILAIAATLSTITIAGFLTHRTYQLNAAAQDIAARVHAHPTRSPLLFGVSAAQIGLIARLPSINAAYGIDNMSLKVARYKPGWYLAWNDDTDRDAFTGQSLIPVSSYQIFDDDTRTTLTLYKIQ